MVYIPLVGYIDAIYIVLGVEILGGLGTILGLFLYNKNRFTVNLCEKYLKTFKIVKQMKVKIDATNFKWKDFLYYIDYSCAIIDKKNKPLLYYLVKGARPIKPFTGMEIKEDSQTFKVYNDGKTMQHLGNRKMDKTFMYIIIALIAVCAIVIVFSLYTSSQNNKNILELSKSVMNITKSLINQQGGIVIK